MVTFKRALCNHGTTRRKPSGKIVPASNVALSEIVNSTPQLPDFIQNFPNGTHTGFVWDSWDLREIAPYLSHFPISTSLIFIFDKRIKRAGFHFYYLR